MARKPGKRNMITGDAGGVDLATATRLIDDGARVIVTGHGAASLDVARAALGVEATAVQSDMAPLNPVSVLAHGVRDDLAGWTQPGSAERRPASLDGRRRRRSRLLARR